MGVLAAFVQLVFAIYLYGALLWPSNVAWLMHQGDAYQHHMGWEFFRREGWTWPIGSIQTLASAVGTSVVFTDSIPLLAIPLKLLAPWLPADFQYQGVWMLISMILNGWMAYRMLRACKLAPSIALLTTLLMCSMPIIIVRGISLYGHESLTAHWLIFWAISIYLEDNKPHRARSSEWFAVLAIAVATHFYLFVMVAVFWLTWLVQSLVSELPRRHWRQALGTLAGQALPTLALVAVLMYAMGYFLPNRGKVDPQQFVIFSAEILSYFNPRSNSWFFDQTFTTMSSFLKGWAPSTSGQYEGMAYAGLGVLMVWGVTLCGRLFRPGEQAATPLRTPAMKWLVLAGIAMFVYGIAAQVTLGGLRLVVLPGGVFGEIRSILRSSGRMVWPLLYLLILLSVIQLSQQLSRARMLVLLAVALLVQVVDLKPFYQVTRDKARIAHQYGVQDPYVFPVARDQFLGPVWATYSKIEAFPAQNLDRLKPYLKIASRHGMSINIAYLAQHDEQTLGRGIEGVMAQFAQGSLPRDRVYLVLSEDIALAPTCDSPAWRCKTHNQVTIVWPAQAGP